MRISKNTLATYSIFAVFAAGCLASPLRSSASALAKMRSAKFSQYAQSSSGEISPASGFVRSSVSISEPSVAIISPLLSDTFRPSSIANTRQ